MEKSTEELTSALKEAESINDYLDENQQELINISLPEYLNHLLLEKNLEKKDVIKASQLNLSYGYQIFLGISNPSRDKLLSLAFGYALDLAETQTLLKYVGTPQLYARNQRDSVIMFALERRMDIMTCNDLLDQEGEPILA